MLCGVDRVTCAAAAGAMVGWPLAVSLVIAMDEHTVNAMLSQNITSGVDMLIDPAPSGGLP